MVRDECRGEGGGRWKVKGEEGKGERCNVEERGKKDENGMFRPDVKVEQEKVKIEW